MQRVRILIYFSFIVASSAIAQPSRNSNVQVFTTENGLPSNGIKGLQWDEKTEFLWIATEAGIVRFNGVDFRSYNKENMPSITSERMLFMIRNNAGVIYISDLPGNIFAIDQNKPVLWDSARENVNPYYSNYYLLPVSDDFFRKHSSKSTMASGFSAVTDRIVCFSDTTCFILHSNTLYYQAINLKEPAPLPYEARSFETIFKIGNNCFITNNKMETFLLDPKNQTLSPVSIRDENGNKLKAAINNSHLFWEQGMQKPIFIDGESAWIFDYDEKNIIAKLIVTGIPPDIFIKSIQFSEANNTLFIGTESKGLIVINQNRVKSKKRIDTNSKNRNSYYSQVELPGGNVLTNEGDIIGTSIPTVASLPIQGKFSFNITWTNDSLLWYNQANTKLGINCLHRYNSLTHQIKVFEKIRTGDLVTVSGSDIYLANPNGIGILDGDSLRFLYKYSEKATGRITFDFREISPGILAIATCGGLFRFNTTTFLLDTLFTKENICVRSIWKYKDYIFFGSYGSGFYIYKNRTVKQMPLDKNKYLLYTHCFVADDKGYCWISTNRGLFKASLDELINVFDNNGNSVYYHYFGKKDGMEMTELNGGCTPCALKLKNDIISFPTMDGLLWVNPEKAAPILPKGDIYIDDVIIDNVNRDPSYLAGHPLPAGTHDIIIHLAFSAWCNKENIYLEYQLNDTLNWKSVDYENSAEISFNNLPYGSYKLKIRKLNGFGFNNFTYKEISFSITTPWHKRWWFNVLLALALLGSVGIYLRIRTNQYRVRQQKLETQVAEKTKELMEKNEVLEKNNTIKTRLISIISHDIITPLKFVTVAGQNLIGKRDLMSEEMQKETILEITNTSQQLHLLSTNILNWIKYQNENRRLAKEQFNLYEMVNQVLGILNSLAKQKNLHLLNTVDKELLIYQYFEPLKILIYNLLTNAINFSERSTILISANTVDEKVVVSVKDEGEGMTADQIRNIMSDQFIVSSANIDNKKGNGLGYLIIKDLVKMMEATLYINSNKGSGTTVSIHLPLVKVPKAASGNL